MQKTHTQKNTKTLQEKQEGLKKRAFYWINVVQWSSIEMGQCASRGGTSHRGGGGRRRGDSASDYIPRRHGCFGIIKEYKSRFYIARKCVVMLICWHKYGKYIYWVEIFHIFFFVLFHLSITKPLYLIWDHSTRGWRQWKFVVEQFYLSY